MKQAAKIIGTGLASTGLIGARIKAIIGTALHCLVTSPPKPHAFASRQLNSGFSFNWSLLKTKLKEKFIWLNGLRLLTFLLLGYSLRVYIIIKWGEQLNNLYLYITSQGAVGLFLWFVQSLVDSIEYIKYANTLKMSANGVNIPAGVGGGNNAPQGPAGPANNPP